MGSEMCIRDRESQPAVVLEGGRAFTPAGAHAADFLRRIAEDAGRASA